MARIAFRSRTFHRLAVVGALLAAGVPLADGLKAASGSAGPTLFAPGLISTGDGESHVTFSPDGRRLYFVKQTPDFAHWTVVTSDRAGSGWSEPAIAWFSGRWDDADVSFSPDGETLFFISDRPDGEAGPPREDTDLFRMRRTAAGWDPPQRIAELGSAGNDWYPNQAASGTLYFGSEREKGNLGPKGTADLWRARWLGTRFAEPENLGPTINTAGEDIEAWVSPDESYLVFASKGRPDTLGSYDFYVSHQCDGAWTTPRPLGGGVNSPHWDFGGRFSPDGATFYFASNRPRAHRAGDAAALRGREGYLRLLEEVRGPGNGLFDVYTVPAADLGLASPCAPGGTAVQAPSPGPAVRVPRGAPAVIDGRMDDAEWSGAARQALPDGSSLRLQHDGKSLFLGIAAARPGFPSVCVFDGKAARVLHASAALGSVTYSRSGAEWTTEAKEFAYAMRDPALTEEARTERSAYLARHGWLASTFDMGQGRAQEVQIALEGLREPPALALAYFALEGNTGSVVRWPASLAAGDGCADEKLVRGHVPPRLELDPKTWAVLELDP